MIDYALTALYVLILVTLLVGEFHNPRRLP
jgi:hypothetical protein